MMHCCLPLSNCPSRGLRSRLINASPCFLFHTQLCFFLVLMTHITHSASFLLALDSLLHTAPRSRLHRACCFVSAVHDRLFSEIPYGRPRKLEETYLLSVIGQVIFGRLGILV
ncbi:hypothetical protein BDW75DRAFT_209181 [Aspergillus navahoensis]